MNESLILLVLNFAATAAAYLAFPALLCLTRRKLTLPQIKRITIINGAVIWLAFQIYYLNIGISGVSASVILWSFVANRLMKHFCLDEEQSSTVPSSVPDHSADVEPSAPARYCKHCGGAVDSHTRRCTKCGKQYFRPKKFFNAFAHILSALIIICLVCVLFHQNQYYQDQISELESMIEAKDAIINGRDTSLKMLQKDLDFFCERVVFVEEDSSTYHLYDCPSTKKLENLIAIDLAVAKSLDYSISWCCEIFEKYR